MQFVDLASQYQRIQDNIKTRIDRVLQSQQFIMGPEIAELEEQLADYVGVKHAITCSSGTDALVIPLMAYKLQRTDAVFVPSFTFFASAESISLAGGTPVFVDCDPVTFNIQPEALSKAIAKTKQYGQLTPRGIIPVDLFGLPASYDQITAIARANDLFVLEDACQGFGSTYRGQKAGSFGTAAATSFFPAKPLACYGDGGAIFTNDDDLASIIKSIRIHGQGADKYDNVRIGVNGRLDSIQAAVLLCKLEIFDSELEARNQIAKLYSNYLKDVLVTPTVPEGSVSVWAQYTLVARDAAQKDRIVAGLKSKSIPTACYYPIPAHLSTAYANLGYQLGSLPVSEDLAKRVFSLPMHPYLGEQDVITITSAIKESL